MKKKQGYYKESQMPKVRRKNISSSRLHGEQMEHRLDIIR